MTNTFEFVAGLASFIILVFCLRPILFEPLKNVAKERAERVRASIAEADDILNKAQEQSEVWKSRNASLPGELEQIAAKAKEDAERILSSSSDKAAREASLVLETAGSQAESLRSKLKDELQADLADEVVEQAEAIVRGSIDDSVREDIVETFLAKMGAGHA